MVGYVIHICSTYHADCTDDIIHHKYYTILHISHPFGLSIGIADYTPPLAVQTHLEMNAEAT